VTPADDHHSVTSNEMTGLSYFAIQIQS